MKSCLRNVPTSADYGHEKYEQEGDGVEEDVGVLQDGECWKRTMFLVKFVNPKQTCIAKESDVFKCS